MIALLAVAFADSRADLEEALLARSTGNREVAQSTLVRLTRSLAADDPLRGLALFWSATIYAESGDPEPARVALRDCIRNGPARDDCADLLGRLELERSAMHPPTTWDFRGDHGMVLFWSQTGQGSLTLEEGSLLWESRRIADQAGVVWFAVEGVASRLSFSVSTPAERAVVLPLFMDDRGKAFPARRPVVVTERERTIVIPLSEVAGLDRKRLERVVFRDLTETTGGTTAVRFGSVSLR